MIKKIILKAKYKRLYIKTRDYPLYTGHSLQLSLDSKYYNLCKNFNVTADKLQLLEEPVPKFRYSLI